MAAQPMAVSMQPRPNGENPKPSSDLPKDAERQTRSLAGLAVALALLVAGLLLVQTLRHGSQVEDCLLAGRINCDRLVNH